MEEDLMKEELGAIHSGDEAVWRYLDFGKGARKVAVKVKSGLGGKIVIKADDKVLGSVSVPADADWVVYEASVEAVKGIHALSVECSGPEATEDSELFRMEWIRFSK